MTINADADVGRKNHYTLETVAATLEISLEVSQKTRNKAVM